MPIIKIIFIYLRNPARRNSEEFQKNSRRVPEEFQQSSKRVPEE